MYSKQLKFFVFFLMLVWQPPHRVVIHPVIWTNFEPPAKQAFPRGLVSHLVAEWLPCIAAILERMLGVWFYLSFPTILLPALPPAYLWIPYSLSYYPGLCGLWPKKKSDFTAKAVTWLHKTDRSFHGQHHLEAIFQQKWKTVYETVNCCLERQSKSSIRNKNL